MDILKEIIKKITPFLRDLGFSKKGNTFYLKLDGNFGIINFQKSQYSNKDEVKFTINFGVYSDVLGQFFDFSYSNQKIPDVWSCQWEARIGQFMPNNPDHWWYLNPSDSISNIISDIMEIIQNIVIPELNKHISDDNLLQCWMNESNYAGTTEIGRFEYLTTLLKKKDDVDTLNQVVDTFMQQPDGKKYYDIVKEHLEEIGYNDLL